MSAQLPLALRWPAHQRFERFEAGANATALALVRGLAEAVGGARVFLAGPSGSGKTHLLIAACAEAGALDQPAQYLDLATTRAASVRAFHGSRLLAVDNVDAIAGNADAEHALFDLYNRCRADETNLLFAAHAAPAHNGLGLPDLVSRLSACTQAILQPLDEANRRRLLQDHAAARGIELDEIVLDWLFSRRARDLGSLMRLLDRIDAAALAAQRRVTVPFLRSLPDSAE